MGTYGPVAMSALIVSKGQAGPIEAGQPSFEYVLSSGDYGLFVVAGGEDIIGRCFPARKEFRLGARWIVEIVDIAT